MTDHLMECSISVHPQSIYLLWFVNGRMEWGGVRKVGMVRVGWGVKVVCGATWGMGRGREEGIGRGGVGRRRW